jgi:hypothetical protein
VSGIARTKLLRSRYPIRVQPLKWALWVLAPGRHCAAQCAPDHETAARKLAELGTLTNPRTGLTGLPCGDTARVWFVYSLRSLRVCHGACVRASWRSNRLAPRASGQVPRPGVLTRSPARPNGAGTAQGPRLQARPVTSHGAPRRCDGNAGLDRATPVGLTQHPEPLLAAPAGSAQPPGASKRPQ